MSRALPITVALVVVLTGCSERRYHWTDVPYCEVAPGRAGSHFEGTLRVLSEHDGGGGISTLHGMRPNRGVVTEDEVLVAVVACASDELLPAAHDLDVVLDAYGDGAVPEVCAGQRLVVPPTRVTAEPTTQSGYDGALRFPPVPPEALRCAAGAVTLGRSP